MKKRLIVRLLASLAAVIVVAAVAGVGFIYLAPETATSAFFHVERTRAGLVRKEIDMPDGLHFAYLDGGSGDPLILLHGFGANKDAFNRVARYLTSHYRVIVPDQIGFGESAHPPDADYSPIAQAGRLHSLIGALGLKTVHLGGSSMGGQIAMTYSARYPSDVASLWLISPAGIWSAPESELRKIIGETGQNPLLVRNEDEFARLLPFVMTDPPFVPRPILNVLAQERIRNFTLEQRIFVQIASDSIEERIKGLSTPTLIVWGDQDRTINVATAEILHGLLPRSRTVIMPGIGHVPMIERPQQSADDYLRFRTSL